MGRSVECDYMYLKALHSPCPSCQDKKYYVINNGDRAIGLNSDCNHMSDFKTNSVESPICLITSLITGRIGRHEVLLLLLLIITTTKFVIF